MHPKVILQINPIIINQVATLRNNTTPEIIATVRVPKTPEGRLSKIIPEEEKKLKKVSRKAVKIVEDTGVCLRKLLVGSDISIGKHCGHATCMTFRDSAVALGLVGALRAWISARETEGSAARTGSH